MMEKWSPGFGFGASLTHVELRFNIMPKVFSTHYIKYTFRKLPDGKHDISSSTGDDLCCMCRDHRALEYWKSGLQTDEAVSATLIQEAIRFVTSRRATLEKDMGMLEDRSGFFRGRLDVCDKCSLPDVTELESEP